MNQRIARFAARSGQRELEGPYRKHARIPLQSGCGKSVEDGDAPATPIRSQNRSESRTPLLAEALAREADGVVLLRGYRFQEASLPMVIQRDSYAGGPDLTFQINGVATR